ncbi:MAG TPA: hypothetical protein VJK52_02245 [Candidatus Nanoarchaeia archaeon]|nr:hypothetical protein [Candidatus Nanoarchaeia archaeon]
MGTRYSRASGALASLALLATGCVNDDALRYEFKGGPLKGYDLVELRVQGMFEDDYCRATKGKQTTTFFFEGSIVGHGLHPYRISFSEGRTVQTYIPEEVQKTTWAQWDQRFQDILKGIADHKDKDLQKRLKS